MNICGGIRFKVNNGTKTASGDLMESTVQFSDLMGM